MKSNLLFGLSLILALIKSDNLSAICPDYDIHLTTQQQVDHFSTTYYHCTEIREWRNLIIDGPGIFNLLGLAGLTDIGGNLIINNTQLTSLEGLHNIIRIGRDTWNGSLEITNNSLLQNLDGLRSLTFVGNHILIEDNWSLSSIDGLSDLISVGDFFFIHSNESLLEVTGINNLLSIGHNLSLYKNSWLNTISGFNSLASIGNKLFIVQNQRLDSISGFMALSTIGGELNLSNNPLLNICEGLCPVILASGIGGPITIGGNTNPCNSILDINTMCLAPLPSLPVNLISFRGMEEDNHILLVWETASEENHDYFQLERSSDGISFSSLGRLPGENSHKIIRQYEWLDTKALPGINYYRLAIVDLDGNVEYSQVISLNKRNNPKIRIYPTLANNWIRINTDEFQRWELEIFEYSGRRVLYRMLEKFDSKINIGELQNGIYVVRITSDQGEQMIQKIIRQN